VTPVRPEPATMTEEPLGNANAEGTLVPDCVARNPGYKPIARLGLALSSIRATCCHLLRATVVRTWTWP
jgi:hypothetical protein